MSEKPPDKLPGYHSFLLRLWKENNNAGTVKGKPTVWRGSLQIPGSRVPILFNSLEELTGYLFDLIGKQRNG